MKMEWVYLVLFGTVCFGLMAIAFRPAWQEWRDPTDCEPLPVASTYSNNIEHFATQFRALALSKLATRTLALDSYVKFLPATVSSVDWADARTPLIADASLTTVGPIDCKAPLFVNGDLHAEQPATFTALLAEGEVELAPNSKILDWAHAEKTLRLGRSCVALRRVSSRTAIEMASQCCFERLHAPVIRFGTTHPPKILKDAHELVESSFLNVHGVSRRSASLFMAKGDCRLPHGHLYRGSLVVTGRLYIGSHTKVVGDVKARGGVLLGSHAEVTGALCSDQQIQILQGALVAGPVISETVVMLGVHARVGQPDQPTTISAANVVAESGSVAHGSVWARDMGVTWSA